MLAESIASFIRPRSSRGPLDNFWYRPVGSKSSAGVDVTAESAMQVSTAFACVRFLSETIGSLPCHVMEEIGERRKRKAREHWLWRLLHGKPNAWQSSMEWCEMGVMHLNVRGNWYNRIIWNWDGTAEQLIPLNPDRVEPKQLDDGTIQYIHKPSGQEPKTYAQQDILHVRLMSANGVTGMSVLEQARNAIGLASAQETHGASLFKNGAMPAFWIKRPAGKRWGPEERKNFRESWRAIHSGAENAHNPPILEDDMSLENLGFNNEDSQWIQSRNLQGYEICRFFRVPPHVVGILDRSTFSNIEHQGLELVIYTLMPWLVRLEQAYKLQLIGDPDSPFFIKHNVDGLLRGDIKARYDAYNVGIQAGWMTRNEAREKEDLDALPDLDEPLQPLNMVPAGEEPEPSSAQKVPVRDEEDDEEEEDDGTRATVNRPAFDVLIDDAAARIAAAEIRMLEPRVAKAASDRKKWDTWAAGEYEKHKAYIIKTLSPLAASWESAGGQPVDVADIASCLVGLSLAELASDDPVYVLGWWADKKAAMTAAFIREAFR